MSIRNTSPKKKRVDVAREAPIRDVIANNRSYHIARIKSKKPVRSQIKENSSLSFLFLTSSIMTIKIMILIRIANICCLNGI
jgi:hypothetical protein